VATVLVVGVGAAVLWRLLPPRSVGSRVTAREVARFVRADYVGELCWTTVVFGLPVVVLARLGAEAAATFGIAWTIAYALHLVPHGMGQSMVAHLAADPAGLAERAAGCCCGPTRCWCPPCSCWSSGHGRCSRCSGRTTRQRVSRCWHCPCCPRCPTSWCGRPSPWPGSGVDRVCSSAFRRRWRRSCSAAPGCSHRGSGWPASASHLLATQAMAALAVLTAGRRA
jgi:hypothetical protein